MEEQRSPGKPFDIPKWEVRRAWEKVRANKGAPGVDDVSIAGFEKDLKGNLYKIWNRMSSGSYFPPPVKAVEIPRAGGGVRLLGVPGPTGRGLWPPLGIHPGARGGVPVSALPAGAEGYFDAAEGTGYTYAQI
jgi:hypothetical protein